VSRREKALARLLSVPSDLTWDELKCALGAFGYEEQTKGKTAGSRRVFRADGLPEIRLHAPHNPPIVRRYAIEDVIATLKAEGLIE
jgi:hypothetical protein